MGWFQKTPQLGRTLLSVWLIASGVLTLAPAVNFAGSGAMLALLGIAAGVLLLIER